MTWKVVWDTDVYEVVWTNAVDGEEIKQIPLVLPADRRFDDARWALHDFTAASSLTVSDAQMEEYAAFASVAEGCNPRLRFALIPDRQDVLDFFNAHQRSGFDAYEGRVFHGRDEALRWLKSGRS